VIITTAPARATRAKMAKTMISTMPASGGEAVSYEL
jgi:hypothetical protein